MKLLEGHILKMFKNPFLFKKKKFKNTYINYKILIYHHD